MKFLCALVLGCLVPLAAFAGERSFAGQTPQPDGKAAWRVVLVLRDNGVATMRIAKTSVNNSIENAVWKNTETGDISVQFLNRSGRPRGEPMVFKADGSILTPSTWDKTSWGESGPPTLRKA